MRTRYEAYIDGAPLSSVSPAIYVTDIQEAAPNVRRTTANYPTGDGQRVLRAVRQFLRVTVAFEIHDPSVTSRAGICQRVQEWARGGRFLAVNTRPGQRLMVEVEQQPVVTSALQWTQALKVVFAAYAVPFWQDDPPAAVQIAGNGSATAFVPGNADKSLCEATVENTGSSAITSVTLGAGDTRMTFSGISIPAKGALRVAYDGDLRLVAQVNGASVLDKRTPESDDDLLTPCGQSVTFTAQAGASSKTTFSVRGWYA